MSFMVEYGLFIFLAVLTGVFVSQKTYGTAIVFGFATFQQMLKVTAMSIAFRLVP